MPWSWKPLVLLLEPSLSIRGTCMSIWEWITGLQWLTCWRWGETRSPLLLGTAQELRDYALNKQITVTAEYLPEDLNHEADWQSTNFRDSSNWKLNPTVFQSLNHQWVPLTIDLFADRMNTQPQIYISWFPDAFAQRTDAFQITWLQFFSFLNDMSLSGKDPKGSRNDCSHNTNMARTSVV